MNFPAGNRTVWYVATDAQGAHVTGTVALTVLTAVLLFLVLLDTITWKVQFRYLKENLQDAGLYLREWLHNHQPKTENGPHL